MIETLALPARNCRCSAGGAILIGMTRLDVSRTWTVERSADDTREIVDRYLLDTGLRILSEDEKSITAVGGSQRMARTIGLFFVDPAAYPRGMAITFTGSQVRATVEEQLGFGILDRRSRANYLRAFQAWLNGLAGVLGSPAREVAG